MKVFRWMCLLYIVVCIAISIMVGERYSYYVTGLVGYTPTHSQWAQEDLEYYEHQGFGCKLCKGALGGLKPLMWSNFTYQNIISVVKTVGGFATGEPDLSEYLFDSFGVPVYNNLHMRLFDVDYMCFEIGACDDYFYKKHDPQDYIDRILKEKPETKRDYPKEKPEKLVRMLQLSDAHVDRNYFEGATTECAAATCCRPHYGYGEGDTAAGYWGFLGKCDIPMRTAEVGLEYIVNQDADFIIWTGDNLDHYVWYQSYENQFFNQRYLKKYLLEDLNWTKPIYPVLGNHEGVPSDMFNFTMNTWVFETFADIWKDFLTPEAYHNMSNFGYYHMKHLDTNLRIIGTFSLVYDIQNWHLVPNHTDPLNHFVFLEETLKMCEENGEVAYLLGHIPPGDVFVLGDWSTRFRALVSRFTNIIRGQFYGHTHYDEFKNIKTFDDEELSSGIVWAVGSFTSYPKKQPGLRIWEVDPETWHVWNYEQHRMYVNETNIAANRVRENPDYTEEELRATGKWQLAYTFKEYFDLPDMQFETIANYIERIKTDKEVARKIITMMHCEGPDSVDRQNEQHWTYCRYSNSVFDDHWACNGNTGNMLDYVFQGLQMAHGDSGRWWHKEPTEKYTRK